MQDTIIYRLKMTLNKRLKGEAGKRFKRFVLAAVIALASSQITLTVCLGVLHISGGASGFIAWVAGATASYMTSRWAWERRGKPDLLRETLPFWLVAACVAIALTSAAHFASGAASSIGLTGTQRVLFVDAAFFLANCVTFVCRFLFFHYVLFTSMSLRARNLNQVEKSH